MLRERAFASVHPDSGSTTTAARSSWTAAGSAADVTACSQGSTGSRWAGSIAWRAESLLSYFGGRRIATSCGRRLPTVDLDRFSDCLLVEDARLDRLRGHARVVTKGIASLKALAQIKPDGFGLIPAGLEPENRVASPLGFSLQVLQDARRDAQPPGCRPRVHPLYFGVTVTEGDAAAPHGNAVSSCYEERHVP